MAKFINERIEHEDGWRLTVRAYDTGGAGTVFEYIAQMNHDHSKVETFRRYHDAKEWAEEHIARRAGVPEVGAEVPDRVVAGSWEPGVTACTETLLAAMERHRDPDVRNSVEALLGDRDWTRTSGETFGGQEALYVRHDPNFTQVAQWATPEGGWEFASANPAIIAALNCSANIYEAICDASGGKPTMDEVTKTLEALASTIGQTAASLSRAVTSYVDVSVAEHIEREAGNIVDSISDANVADEALAHLAAVREAVDATRTKAYEDLNTAEEATSLLTSEATSAAPEVVADVKAEQRRSENQAKLDRMKGLVEALDKRGMTPQTARAVKD